MKRFTYIILTLLLTLATACDPVSEDERLIYMKPAQVARNVLIEDFTGQRCVNCPAATWQIEQLQEQYGADAVIAVGIHSGPLGFAGNKDNIGLMTDTGNEYYNRWSVEYQPAGVIDRNGGVLAYTDWQAKVYEELQKPAPLSLIIAPKYDALSRQLSIDVTAAGTDGSTNGNLQIWLIEDGVKALQLRYNNVTDASSGQVADREYVHNHVFRTAVNGTWGEAITLNEGDQKTVSATCILQEDWNPAQMSVVAFVYNDQGVAQCAIQKISDAQ